MHDGLFLGGLGAWRRQFIEQHGDKVPDGQGMYLFEDGYRLAQDYDNGHWESPPLKKVDQLKLRELFYRLKAKRARDHLRQLKLQCLVTFCGKKVHEAVVLYQGSKKQATADLKEAKAAVRHWDYLAQNMYLRIKSEIGGPKWREHEAALEQGDNERAAEQSKFEEMIKAL